MDRIRNESSRHVLRGLFPLVVTCCLVAACSGTASPRPSTPSVSPSPTPPSAPCTATNWTVDFTRSGGFAGRTRSLRLSSSGSLTASEPEQNLVVQSTLTPGELAQMGQLLQAACPFSTSARPTSCPDCFSYALEIQMGGQTYSARATDVDLSGLGALIQALNSLLNKSLSGQP